MSPKKVPGKRRQPLPRLLIHQKGGHTNVVNNNKKKKASNIISIPFGTKIKETEKKRLTAQQVKAIHELLRVFGVG